MESLYSSTFRSEQENREKKKLQTGICRIWKSLSRDQGEREPMKGNGVLVYDPSFIKSELKVNAEYAILTSRKTWKDLSNDEEGNYKVDFRCLNKSKSKEPVSVNDIEYSSFPKGSLVFSVLNTSNVKKFLFKNSAPDRAFNKIDWKCSLKVGDEVYCHWVKSSKVDSFEVEHCQLKCACKSKCGDFVVDNIPGNLSDLPLGSLILNDQKKVQGVLGKDSNGKYVVNTVAAVVNEAQGIICLTNLMHLL